MNELFTHSIPIPISIPLTEMEKSMREESESSESSESLEPSELSEPPEPSESP